MDNTNKIMSLDGTWELTGFPECDEMPLTPEELAHYPSKRIEACVPGNVELDLSRAGILPEVSEMMRGLNLTKLRKYECYDWWYTKEFGREEWFDEGSQELVFEGLDCFATIWLNGVKIGETHNAKLRYIFDITKYLKERNTLCIRLAAPLNMVRNKNYDDCFGSSSAKFDSLFIRKPYHAFGTDINPRVLTGGIWRSVWIQRKKEYDIRDIYVYTLDLAEDRKKADLMVSAFLAIPGYSFEGLRVKVICTSPDGEKTEYVSREMTFCYFESTPITLNDPKLWWPLGYGEHPLYDITIELYKDDQLVASKTVKHGIRSFEFGRTDLNLPEKPGKFQFKVNGERIFIRGCNWIWANIFHSMDKDVVMDLVPLFKDLRCNMIRLHGGGVFEPHEFYDFCDRNGIMVWQDLGMSALAYPQNDEFAELIGEEVRWAVKELRNHTSIVLWCGNNEGDSMRAFGWYGRKQNPDSDRVTREFLPRILSGLDPVRPYLPSSPYHTGECALRILADNTDERHFIAPEAHVWGPRDYCKSDFYYKNNRCCFSSEAGFPGISNLSLLKKYLSPDKVWPMTDNQEWNYHGTESILYQTGTFYRMRQSGEQLDRMFGEVPKDIETYVKVSQVFQAESDKFLMEFYRLQKWKKTGLLLWNLIDSWPQTISDSYFDYDRNRKLVFYYLLRSSQEFAVLCSEPENGEISIVAANETLTPVRGTVEVSVYGTDKTYRFPFEAKANDNTVAGKIEEPAGPALLLLKWQCDSEQYSGVNHYISGPTPYPMQTYLQEWLPQIAALDGSFAAENIGK